MARTARLFVVSGPSGVGKGTLVARVRAKRPDLGLTVSATTRTPRAGEVDGTSYYYLTEDESCDLEKEPLQRLAADGELSMYPHPGSWQCMDTLRDSIQLNELWNAGKAFWTGAAHGHGKEA